MAAIDLTSERADPNLVLTRMFSIADESNTYSSTVAAQISGHLELAARMLKYGHIPPKFSTADPDGKRRVGFGKWSSDFASVGQAVISLTGIPADAGTLTIDDGGGMDRVFEYDTGDDGIACTSQVEIDTGAAATTQDAIDATVAAINGDQAAGNINVYAIDMGDGATIALIATFAGVDADLQLQESATNLTVTDFQFDADAS